MLGAIDGQTGGSMPAGGAENLRREELQRPVLTR